MPSSISSTWFPPTKVVYLTDLSFIVSFFISFFFIEKAYIWSITVLFNLYIHIFCINHCFLINEMKWYTFFFIILRLKEKTQK